MRRNASTVVALPNPVSAEVLAAVDRSMNVTLIRPDETASDHDDDLEAAAGMLRRAGRSASPYALVAADPLAAVAASWQAMWDVSRPDGPAPSSGTRRGPWTRGGPAGSSCPTTTWP